MVTYPPRARASSASSVERSRTEVSWRPCTSCSSCTANSMSRMPPVPRFTSRSSTPLRRSISSVRGLHRAHVAHGVGGRARRATRTAGSVPGTPRPSGVSPTTARALIRAWSSHVHAHRSQYRGIALERAAQGAGAPFRPQVGIGAEHDAIGGRFAHDAQHPPRRVFGGFCRTVAFVNEEHVDIARVVQLRATELAHTDDSQRHVRCGELERDVEACVHERREITATVRKSAIARRSRPAMRVISDCFHRRKARRRFVGAQERVRRPRGIQGLPCARGVPPAGASSP